MAAPSAVEPIAAGVLGTGAIRPRPVPSLRPVPAPVSHTDQPDRRAGRVRRSAADRAVDSAAFVLAIGLGGLFMLSTVVSAREPLSTTTIVVDIACGIFSCLALWLRRRWPAGVALAVLLPGALSAAGGVACLIALFTVAVRRPVKILIPIAALHLVGCVVYAQLRPQKHESFWVMMAYSVAVISAIVAWGMFARARRLLVFSLRERAERAEAQQRLHVEQARAAERSRIAREMHDVLAHRVSMVALHAGALEVRPDLPPPDVARTAALIRSSAREALEELRSVIGVLREDAGPDAADDAPQAPQPTLDDIARLVGDSRRAGMHVELAMQVDAAEMAPGVLGRDAYRIIQEGLTNVSKHARGTATTVSVDGGPGAGLHVVVRNWLPVGVGTDPALPGSGTGLVGLAERVALSGGTLSHGPSDDGHFVVDAHLPWAA